MEVHDHQHSDRIRYLKKNQWCGGSEAMLPPLARVLEGVPKCLRGTKLLLSRQYLQSYKREY